MSFWRRFYRKIVRGSVWARPNMLVVFRAEIMPGKTREERTFKIDQVLPSGRVRLDGFAGDHRESEFERTTF